MLTANPLQIPLDRLLLPQIPKVGEPGGEVTVAEEGMNLAMAGRAQRDGRQLVRTLPFAPALGSGNEVMLCQRGDFSLAQSTDAEFHPFFYGDRARKEILKP